MIPKKIKYNLHYEINKPFLAENKLYLAALNINKPNLAENINTVNQFSKSLFSKPSYYCKFEFVRLVLSVHTDPNGRC